MAIIKYRVEAGTAKSVRNADKDVISSTWQYEEITAPDKAGKILSREEALERIRELGLVMVHKMGYGAIWDLPTEPFYDKYAGFFSRKRIR